MHHKISSILLLLIFCNTANSQVIQSASVTPDSILNDLEIKIRKELTHGGSFSVAVAHKDQIIWSKAFGFSDQKSQIPADTSTIYRIGSITKSFTAFAMMQLVEKGMLKLTDPVELYLPEIKNLKGYNDARKITFLQLANHTSGLQRDPPLKNAAGGSIDEWENKVLESIPATSIITVPGKKFNYSNFGYAILGLAISKAAKEPYTALIEQNIFIPLQMHNSYFVVPQDKINKLAKKGTTDSNGAFVQGPDQEQVTYGYIVPCGGIYSTPNDLLKFAMANQGVYSLLDARDRRLMQSGSVKIVSSSQKTGLEFISLFLSKESKSRLRIVLHTQYGLGFQVYTNKNMKVVGHNGLLSSYSSRLFFEDSSKYSVVLLRNYRIGKISMDKCGIELLSQLQELKK